MKKLFAIIALAASAYASAQAQGRVVFPNTFSTKISTNGALGGAATGFVAPQSAGQVFYYAMFASATETTVGGSTAAVIPTASGNGTYVFNAANAGSWFQVERGTNHASGAGFIRCPFETVILGVESLSTAQFVVVGWSANLGTDISQVAANLGTTAGWLGQSVVSGPIETGVHPILPSIFGTAAPAIPGFTLGLVRPSGFGSPIITLNGAAIVTNECHTVFADPGANNSAGFAVSVSGGFGTNNSPDTYVLTYTGTDAFGNVGTTNRIVVERDTLPPVITLLGNNPHYLVTNTPFIDPGATALDLCGGAIAVSSNSPVNLAVEGTYLVSYTAADSSGNAATNFRTVIVTRAPTTLVVTTTNDNGAGSLRDTVSNSVFGDKITFAAGLSGKMILLTNGQITVDRNLTVDASALAGGLMINGSGAGRIFLTTNNTVVALISLTLTNGRVTKAAGGCLFNSTNCTLNLTNCTLTGNSAVGPNGPNGVGAVGPNCVGRPGGLGGTGTGGGIYNAGTLFLHGSRLSGNSALGGNGGSGANTPCGSGQPTEGGWGGSGGAAQGGAIVNVGSMTLNLNKLTWNIATAGTGGTGGTSGRIGGRGGNGGDSKGGGICNFGTLTLDQNTFASNSVAGGSGGIGADGGGGSIEDLGGTGGSGGSGSGSGLYNAGMLAVNQNTFATNSANGGSGGNGGSATGGNSNRKAGWGGAGQDGRGGGIYNAGLMTLGQNTFTGNTANGGNGGNCGNNTTLYAYGGYGGGGSGGGICNVTDLAVIQCTIFSNAVSGGTGGAGFTSGDNGTEGSGTGGGIFTSGALTLTNTIVAGNSALQTNDIAGPFTAVNCLTNLDPRLAPLGDYGGPTATMPPLLGSPAIDTGSDSAASQFATDQRGFARKVGAHVDIGAAEASFQLVVTTSADSGAGSLRQAIADAPSGYTIIFTNSLSGATILLTNGRLLLGRNLAIDATALHEGVTISGNNATRIFQVTGGATVSLAGLTIAHGQQPDPEGGVVQSESGTTLHVSRCTFANNTGGGIWTRGVLLTVDQSTFHGNSSFYGGAVNGNYAPTIISHCTISGNTGSYGGGVFYVGTSLTISNSIIAGNISVETVDPNAQTGRDIYGQIGTLRLAGANLIPFFFEDRPVVARTGSDPLTGDPHLAPLGHYGGPTPTMPPLPGSPALDGCTSGTPFTTDQRGPGFPRVMNAYADIGAAEALVPSIPNASFEADTFTVYPGYANANGGGITGWALSDPGSIGVNNTSFPFANNGVTPAGANVAFIQGSSVNTNALSTTISGLTPGAAYRVSFRANTRNYFPVTPDPTWSVNGGPLTAFTAAPPVNADGVRTQPYYANSAVFVATGTTAPLVVQNGPVGGFSSLLLDAFTVAPMLVVVTTNNNSGPGSLRQAIAEVADGGNITFAPGLSGQTILLTSGELVLGKSVTIDASALTNGLTLNGNNTSRIVEVNSGNTVFLTALTLTNGNAIFFEGGGILNHGTLTLNQSTLAGNQAEYGGGICNNGTLMLNQSTLAGNRANDTRNTGGGGINNSGTLTVNQSTFTGNQAEEGGGGIFDRGILTVNQSTFTGNGARVGGGIHSVGSLTVNQSTLSGNSAQYGGGIYIYDTLTLNLTNSIVAGNSASIAGLNIYGSYTGNNNLTSGDPLLAPLGNYGGPTPTMPPLPGSPAINTAAATGLTTDQRGFPRPVGPAPDIGAVEGPVPPTPFVAAGGPWKYLADGSDQVTAWRERIFDDSTWSNGTARLGFGGDGETTTIASAASNFVTFYFRQSFTVANAAAVSNLFGQLQVDDGVILYLNGTEIYRRNMTNEPATLNYLSLASFTVAGADEQTFWTFATNSLALVDGVNVLAAEVHQATTNSSDLGFTLDLVGNYNGELPPVIAVTSPTTTAPYNAAGLPLLVSARDPEGTVTNVDFYVDGLMVGRATTAPFTGLWLPPALGAHTVHAVATDNTGLTAVSPNQPFTVVPPSVLTTLVNSNSTWRYLDDGSNQGTLWRTNTYNDAGWSNGVAELGYGDGPALPEATIIRSTGTNGQRIITTYFRKGFTVADPSRYSNLVVRLRRDDGGVVYLNGMEIFRSNMTNGPGGPVLFTDLALNAADEVSFFSGPANASLLRAGDNLVAVEIHQTLATSSDVSFDLQLQAESGPLLFISQGGSLVMLNWLPAIPGLQLQSAPTPVGPWTVAPNQANPQSFTVNPLDPPVFWRLLVP